MIRSHLDLALPRLAWCAQVTRNGDVIDLLHGDGVEVRGDTFFEGAWSGPFDEQRFLDASFVCGSGAELSSEAITFTTPSHTLECLYSIQRSEQLLISNSLSLVLEAAGERLISGWPYYSADIIEFIQGKKGVSTHLSLESAAQLVLYRVCKVRVDSLLRLRIDSIDRTPSFSDFDSYKRFVLEQCSALANNAADAARSRPSSPIATVSSGYDSPACAAIAKVVGASEALTFVDARENFGTTGDSGTPVGEALGLRVIEFARLDYLHRVGLPEVEFLASGAGGEDVIMSAWETRLSDTVLFTGFLGDTVWDMGPVDPEPSEDGRIKYPAGATLGEFRLRVGFVHVPLPILTLRSHRSLMAISRSAEMRRWSTGNASYDRPIPRRLAEEAGVPRDLFGHAKKAVTQPFYHNESLSQVMGAESIRSFREWRKTAPVRLAATHRVLSALLPTLHLLAMTAHYSLSKVAQAFGQRLSVRSPVRMRYQHRVTENAMTFEWSVAVQRQKYSGPVSRWSRRGREER